MTGWRRWISQSGDQELRDKAGNRYWLRTREAEALWMLHLYRRGWFGWCVKAGEAILILKAEQLFELSEISLEPRFRGSGAGSALLSEAVCFARAHGAHRIAGHITAEDYAATPYLFQFYERCGFRVGPPQAAKRLAAIELVL